MVLSEKVTVNVSACVCVSAGAGVLLGLTAVIQAEENNFKGIVCVTKDIVSLLSFHLAAWRSDSHMRSDFTDCNHDHKKNSFRGSL